MTYKYLLQAAERLPLSELGALIGALNTRYQARHVDQLAAEIRGQWPTASILRLEENPYDNGWYLTPVSIDDYNGEPIHDDVDALRDRFEQALTELSDPGGNGLYPHLDLASGELRRDYPTKLETRPASVAAGEGTQRR